MKNWKLIGTGALVAMILAGCGGGGGGVADGGGASAASPGPATFTLATAPTKLSAWNMLNMDGVNVSLRSELVPYDLNSTLFTDYSFKLRALYIPPGQKITYTADGNMEFPVGTVILKTFYYPQTAGGTNASYQPVGLIPSQTEQGNSIKLATHHLVETRVLVRKTDGSWEGIPYVWDADQKDATLTINGKYINLELVPASGATQLINYVVPNSQTCQQCHASETNGSGSTPPIGPKTRNLNKVYDYGNGISKNQLTNLDDLKLLSGFDGNVATAPRNADWKDNTQPINARASAYLDVNCAHCHNGTGYASQSGLNLTLENLTSGISNTWGACKLPLAYVGTGLPGYKYDINVGSPDTSILLYRMSHVAAGQTMPVVGRKSNHIEGMALIQSWITQLPSSVAACAP